MPTPAHAQKKLNLARGGVARNVMSPRMALRAFFMPHVLSRSS